MPRHASPLSVRSLPPTPSIDSPTRRMGSDGLKTPDQVNENSEKKYVTSPVIAGLDLHGLDSTVHRRVNNSPPNLQDGYENLKGGWPLAKGRSASTSPRRHMRRRLAASEDPRHYRSTDTWKLQGRFFDDASGANDASGRHFLMIRSDSESTQEAHENSSDNNDDSFESGFWYNADSGRVQHDAQVGHTIDRFDIEQEAQPLSSGSYQVANKQNWASSPLRARSPDRDDWGLLITDGNAMTGPKLAALRLQLRREKMNEMRQHEKTTIVEHRRIVLEKRRNQRYLREVARFERAHQHKGNRSRSSPTEGGLRLFSRCRSSQDEPPDAKLRRPARFQPVEQPMPVHTVEQTAHHGLLEKRPGGSPPGLHRSVRWDRPQVWTFERSDGLEEHVNGQDVSSTSSES
jgi:hypothetical protein